MGLISSLEKRLTQVLGGISPERKGSVRDAKQVSITNHSAWNVDCSAQLPLLSLYRTVHTALRGGTILLILPSHAK